MIPTHKFMFLLMFLGLQICKIYADKTDLLSMLQQVSGVYNDEKRVTTELKKTVLVTGCNHGFINHLQNFKCFADRLGMKFLVIAMDKQAHTYITQNTTMHSYLMKGGDISGNNSEFRSTQFNLITTRKKQAVLDILSLGFNVLFSDTDVAMTRDPVPYMIWKNVDYVHSLNGMCKINDYWDFHKSNIEGNTGFYFVRSNRNTLKLWSDAIAEAPRQPHLDDQSIFWNVIRGSKDPSVLPLPRCRAFDTDSDKVKETQLVSCVLDPCVFSSGMISKLHVPEQTYEMLLHNLKTLNESIVTLHANYMSGNKKKMMRMKEYGFWLANNIDRDGTPLIHNTNKCAQYVPYEKNNVLATLPAVVAHPK